jgi:hypothetical protein
MALQFHLRNQLDEDTVHAVVRCDQNTYKALKEFMHCDAEVGIRFPHGVRLLPRGRGWYRLEASNSFRAREKVEFAMKAMRRFQRELELSIEEDLRRFAPVMKDPDLKIVSFSNAHSEGEYGYMGVPQHKPASQHKLNALVAKFGRPQN